MFWLHCYLQSDHLAFRPVKPVAVVADNRVDKDLSPAKPNAMSINYQHQKGKGGGQGKQAGEGDKTQTQDRDQVRDQDRATTQDAD